MLHNHEFDQRLQSDLAAGATTKIICVEGRIKCIFYLILG